MAWGSFMLRPFITHHRSLLRPNILNHTVSTAAAIRNGLRKGKGNRAGAFTGSRRDARRLSKDTESRSGYFNAGEKKHVVKTPQTSRSTAVDGQRRSSFEFTKGSRPLQTPTFGNRLTRRAPLSEKSYGTIDSTKSQRSSDQLHFRYKPPWGQVGEPIDTGGRIDSEKFTERRTLGREKPPRPPKKPLSITYTTPASEFLYGTSVVTSALRSDGRALYNLYIYQGEERRSSQQDESMKKLGLARGVKVNTVNSPEWLSLMDRMSTGRPHNGYILEASPLAKRPVISLGAVDLSKGTLRIMLDHQSREDEAVNGTSDALSYQSSGERYPLIVMLDGVIDPGNLGAIVRSAFFLGADAVVISTHSAPLSAVALKASAGAIEGMPLFSVRQTGSFIGSSQQCGWKFYAAVAPPGLSQKLPSAQSTAQQHLTSSTLGDPLMKHPCVLMLGGEGTGLMKDLQKKADFALSIAGARIGVGGVDSLNVSVAAGLLCDAFIRTTLSEEPAEDHTNKKALF